MSSPDLTRAEQEAVQDALRQAGIPPSDLQAVVNLLEGPQLSMGPYLLEFERRIAEYAGARYAIGVNSGTAGLHLCLRASEVGMGDYVLTTPFSFVASTNVILFEHAIPVFVDVDPHTGNVNVAQLAEAARDLVAGGARARRWLPRLGYAGRPSFRRLKAILAVDVFGQPANWDAIGAIGREFGLKLIEDSCESLGSEYKGRKAGMLGDYGVYAFYPNKQITTGEGGVIVTDDEQAARLMRALRNQGRAEGDTWLQHTYLGYNYRLDEMSAALGVAQMGRLEELLSKRAQVATWYDRGLAAIPGVERYAVSAPTTRISWFVYVIKLSPPISRDALSQRLEKRGIPVRPYFPPIHLQPYMIKQFGYRSGDFPVSEDLGRRSLALPFSSVMSEALVEEVCQALREEIGRE